MINSSPINELITVFKDENDQIELVELFNTMLQSGICLFLTRSTIAKFIPTPFYKTTKNN